MNSVPELQQDWVNDGNGYVFPISSTHDDEGIGAIGIEDSKCVGDPDYMTLVLLKILYLIYLCDWYCLRVISYFRLMI